MIEQLKQMYPGHTMTDPATVSSPEHYVWFQSEEGPVGILKSVLTDKEQQLLETFLTPFIAGQPLSDEQSFWHELLFSGKTPPVSNNQNYMPFRLIHFLVKDPAIDDASFSEAVKGLFPNETTVLWETNQAGVLIEHDEPSSEKTIGYEDLVDAVTSDFYTDLLLYVGAKQPQISVAPEQFRREKGYFQLCREHFPSKSVFYHNEQIPFLLLHGTFSATKTELFHELLNEVEDDKDLLHSIYQFLKCDMNVTTAAKELFIHRNSLQYRVDKFVEKTGLDVKSFPQAVTVYLALLEQQARQTESS
ncbi:MAG TPA: helix-turn-helix domain-containing protein [Bacillales bacterium]|nr:helix-turn-helix domain-containing protein [Bacillales bacterium]